MQCNFKLSILITPTTCMQSLTFIQYTLSTKHNRKTLCSSQWFSTAQYSEPLTSYYIDGRLCIIYSLRINNIRLVDAFFCSHQTNTVIRVLRVFFITFYDYISYPYRKCTKEKIFFSFVSILEKMNELENIRG